jgi:hypothetical protein
MRFCFQRRVAPRRWVAIGTTEGSGENAAGEALGRLIREKGTALAAGAYRYRPADAATATWSLLIVRSSSSDRQAVGH